MEKKNTRGARLKLSATAEINPELLEVGCPPRGYGFTTACLLQFPSAGRTSAREEFLSSARGATRVRYTFELDCTQIGRIYARISNILHLQRQHRSRWLNKTLNANAKIEIGVIAGVVNGSWSIYTVCVHLSGHSSFVRRLTLSHDPFARVIFIARSFRRLVK